MTVRSTSWRALPHAIVSATRAPVMLAIATRLNLMIVSACASASASVPSKIFMSA